MSDIQTGKKYFLIKIGMVIGILVFEKRGAEIVAWYQGYPSGKKYYLSEQRGKHISIVFSQVREYFYERDIAIHLKPELMSASDFRDSMWQIFKTHALPQDLCREIEEQAEMECRGFPDRKTRVEIEVFIVLDPIYTGEIERKRHYVYFWNLWFGMWNPNK